MMCFKDMTFCFNFKECDNTECHRHWNDTLSEQARRWWGDETYPVAWSPFKETCGIFKEIKK